MLNESFIPQANEVKEMQLETKEKLKVKSPQYRSDITGIKSSYQR